MQQIEQWLSSAGLEQYIPVFINAQITPQQFTQLTIQDYQQYGITIIQDKQKMFRLLSGLKTADITKPVQVDQGRVLHRQPPVQLNNAVVQPPIQPSNTPRSLPIQLAPQQQQYSQPQQYQQAKTQGKPNQFTNNPTAHPNCPMQIDGRGVPTINKTVIPTDKWFLDSIDQKIRVVMRKRPINKNEIQLGCKDIMSVDGYNQVSLHEPKVKVDLTKYIQVNTFRYDHVFSELADNYEVYFYTAKPLVNAIFQGRNATCFAYGQTGSGKTWTMMQRECGIYVLAANDIFQMLQHDPTYKHLHLQAYVSFYEIYGTKLFDLSGGHKELRALEDGKGCVQIAGLYEQQISTVEEILQFIDDGLKQRQVGATGANADSSRSHAILQIALKSPNLKVHGKMSFIDLAGAERAGDVQNTDRQTRMEGAEINTSLLALKECIRAMEMDKPHKKFRESKLTLILRDSFIKNSKTVMIACCSPSDKSCENTLNTLRYADRVKSFSSGVTSNKVPVIKPSQNVAEMVIGVAANDADIQQQEYQAHLEAMRRGQQVHVQQQFQAYPEPMQQHELQFQNFSQQQQYQQPQQVYQQNAYQEEVFVENHETPSQVDELAQTHSAKVREIYEMEEEMVKAHRIQVDVTMSTVKKEVKLLHQIEANEIGIDQWVQEMEILLNEKEKAILDLKMHIGQFKKQLAEEQQLSDSWKGRK
uniref:Kinesin-like protein n=1 Tax=Trepomonas sp. PC1 TaxID=1076344 RepID=A0A146KJZ5_9EUKA|eukprot:JAP96448.1 Kinesin-13 [Trepomonas sp. PC1]